MFDEIIARSTLTGEGAMIDWCSSCHGYTQN